MAIPATDLSMPPLASACTAPGVTASMLLDANGLARMELHNDGASCRHVVFNVEVDGAPATFSSSVELQPGEAKFIEPQIPNGVPRIESVGECWTITL